MAAEHQPAVDAKVPLLPSSSSPQDDAVNDAAKMRQTRKSRFQVAAFAILLAIFWLARTWTCEHEHELEHNEAHFKVPLEVHIM